MQIGIESDRDIIRQKHHKAVPGPGVFIPPKAVARFFNFMTIPVVRTSKKNMRRCREFSIQAYAQMSIIPGGCFTDTEREDLRTRSGRRDNERSQS